MKLAEVIDRCLEPFSPRMVRQRVAERAALQIVRDYDVATSGRRNSTWRRPGSSADREGQKALTRARDAGYDLVRNNKYAAAIDIHLTAHLVGDGIAPRAVHKNKRIQKAAQEHLDAFFRSKVDGRRDFFGVQKLATSAMIVGGESLIVWGPDDTGPDGRCRVIEGAYLDHLKNLDDGNQNLIVQGVEFDRATGDRVAYWLFDRHPGDISVRSFQSKRYDARYVDHVYDERRPGQTRGISWLATIASTLRDVADTADAKLMKEKVAACLALVLTSADNTPIGPFDEGGSLGTGANGGTDAGNPSDTLRPGLVMRARAGENATVVNPPASGEGVGLMRQELMGVSATTIPYHILSGDPSQANYSSVRSQTNPFAGRIFEAQQHILIPFICLSTAERRMRRLSVQTGDRRFLEVTWKWALPVVRKNDPIKDFTGELMEVRAGTKSMIELLTERGRNPEEHIAEIVAWYAMTDSASLAFDSDPRRVNLAGALQPATGYLAGKPQED
jgi:lambda family phage portal protein